MLEITLKKVTKNLSSGLLEPSSAIALLISILEHSESTLKRIECLKLINQFETKDEKVFKVLENLLISENNEKIKILALSGLKRNFLDKALPAMMHSLQYITSMQVLLDIFQAIGDINTNRSNYILMEELHNIKNKKCQYFVNELERTKNLKINGKFLAKLLVNFRIVDYFEEQCGSVNMTLKNGMVSELSLLSSGSNLKHLNTQKTLPRFIGRLDFLENLNLRINRLLNLPPTIGSLSSLIKLDFSYNKLTQLPESLMSLKSLEELYLRYNNIKIIPDSLGDLRSLKILDLRSNKLKRLPESLGALKSIEKLDLYGNQITELPNSIGELSSLKNLELGSNNLELLPNTMCNLNNLKKLSLGRNKSLNILPRWFGSLHSLEELDLHDTNLNSIPLIIGKLTSLRKLDLRNNNISTISDCLRNLKSLEILNLSWNALTSLPKWIGSLESLKEINLWGNNIIKLSESLKNEVDLHKMEINIKGIKHDSTSSLNILAIDKTKQIG